MYIALGVITVYIKDLIDRNSEACAWIPFTQGCFVQKLVEIGQVVLEKNII